LTVTCSPPSDTGEWEALRRSEFPGARINLNAGTLGTTARSVRAAQRGFWRDGLRAWPLGQYTRGRADLQRARALVAELWGPAPVAVTAGTSETMTRVTLALHARLGPGPIRVLTSGHEHAGGLQGFLDMPGVAVHYLPDHVLADPDAVATIVAEVRPHALFLSQIAYTTGQHIPVERQIAVARGVVPELWAIVDAAQALGLVAPALAGADLVVASCHKWLFGPPGCGLLWMSPRARDELASGAAGEPLDGEAPCAAFDRTGGHDLSVYAGLAAALALHLRLGPAAVRARSAALAGWFAADLHARLRDRGVAHAFIDPGTGELTDAPATERLVGAVHIHFPDRDPYPAYASLDRRGVHLKCIKSTRPTGARLAVLRACVPWYESPARLGGALDSIADALAERP